MTIRHTYKLVLADDGKGCARTIEFEAAGADCAFILAQRDCLGREGELFEDGRPLGRLQLHGNGGYWTISPPTAGAGAA